MKKRAPAKKTAYHHGRLREALIETSLKLIAKEGVERLTLRKVAKMAGVTHAAPYAHFADKDDLIAAVKEEGFGELRRLLAAVAEEKGLSGEARLRRLGQAYLGFALKEPAKFQVMFRRPLYHHKPSYDFIEPGQKIFELVAASLQDWLGSAATLPPQDTTLLAWGMMHGLVSLWIDGPLIHIMPESQTPGELEKLGERMVGHLLGLLETVRGPARSV